MICRRHSALILAAAFSAVPLACSRKPPPLNIDAAADAPAAAAAPPPSAPLPPIEVSPLIRTASTVSARDYRDYPAAIPGVITIRAPNLDSQSHEFGDEPWMAKFLVTNETMTPLTVKISDLTLRAEEATVAPEYMAQAVVAKRARAEGVAVSVERGVVTFTAPPRKHIEVDVDGDFGQGLHLSYHLGYHHEATFSVGEARVIGRGYGMYFRYPH
jgi:hypothetical protein